MHQLPFPDPRIEPSVGQFLLALGESYDIGNLEDHDRTACAPAASRGMPGPGTASRTWYGRSRGAHQLGGSVRASRSALPASAEDFQLQPIPRFAGWFLCPPLSSEYGR